MKQTSTPHGADPAPRIAAHQPLRGLALLLLFQAGGEGLAHWFRWPVPGPVAGMVLLLAALAWAPLRAPVQAGSDLLLGHLSLLFVPVGVGVITHLSLLTSHGAALVAVIVLSTWVGLAVTALVLRALLRGEAGADMSATGTRADG